MQGKIPHLPAFHISIDLRMSILTVIYLSEFAQRISEYAVRLRGFDDINIDIPPALSYELSSFW